METRYPPHVNTRPPHFDVPQQEAYLNLWRTYDCLKSLEDELFGQYQLSAQQYNALRLLRATAPEPIRTLLLAQRLISRAPDITRLLNRLEQRGLVERERSDSNRRVVEVRITADGLQLLKEMDAQVREMHLRQLGHLDQEELRQLTHLLQRARRPHEDDSCDWLNEVSQKSAGQSAR